MGIQDNAYTMGNEAVTYGTAAATKTRGIENQTDDHKVNIVHRTSRGIRKGSVATPTGRSIAVPRGGTGTVTVDLLGTSHGLLLGLLGTLSTVHSGTLAYTHTVQPSTTGPTRSATLHAERADIAGAVHAFDYVGGMATEAKLSIAPQGNVMLALTMDYQTVDSGASTVSPAYPSSPYVFSADDVTVTLDGTIECQKSVEVTLPTGLSTDRYRICGTPNKKKPLVLGRVAPTGTLAMDYPDNTFYDKFVSGETMALVITIASPTFIEDTTPFSLTLTAPAIQFTGDTPSVAIDALPNQPLPFEMLDNGTDPVWKLDYVTSDTTP